MAIAFLAMLVGATSVWACEPYGNQDGAAGFIVPSPVARGVKGQTDVQDAFPAPVAAVVHPVQIFSATSTDFIGWGIYKGEGANPPGGSCADHYSTTTWKFYTDHQIAGVFTCQTIAGTVADNANNQTFQIDYEYCSIYGVFRWRLYWNGVLKACIAINGTTADNLSAGSEEVPQAAPQQNLLVHYENMQYRRTTGGWLNWPIIGVCEDDPP